MGEADKMFKELGYEKEETTRSISYTKKDIDLWFDIGNKTVAKRYYGNRRYNSSKYYNARITSNKQEM